MQPVNSTPKFGRLQDPQLIAHVKNTRKELMKPEPPRALDAPPLTGGEKLKQFFKRISNQIKLWLTELVVPATPTERLKNFFRKLRYI
jgi:hypothetical protein